METGVEAFPYDEFSLVKSFYTPPGSQQSPEMAEVTGMGSSDQSAVEHEWITWHSYLSLPMATSKLTQAQETGVCQGAWQAMWYSDIKK